MTKVGEKVGKNSLTLFEVCIRKNFKNSLIYLMSNGVVPRTTHQQIQADMIIKGIDMKTYIEKFIASEKKLKLKMQMALKKQFKSASIISLGLRNDGANTIQEAVGVIPFG